MSEPVTSDWQQYAGFWTPLIIGAAIFAVLVLVQLERLIRK